MKRLSDAQRDMVSRNIPLALRAARPFERSGSHWVDDVRQEALVALMGAARTWDSSSGRRFSSYAWCRVQWHLTDWMRGEYRRRRRPTCPIADAVGPDVGPIDARDFVEVALRRLPRYEAEVMRSIYIDELNQRETAQRMRRSRASVSQLHSDAIERVRQLPRLAG